MAFHFHHAPSCTPLVDLRIAQMRVYNAWRRFARTARTPLARRWLRGAVVGNQCSHIRRELITGEKRGTTIGSCLQSRQKCGGFRFAALMAEVTQDAQAAGSRHRAPHPHITDLSRIIWLTVRLFFLTKVQSSSIWTWVRWR